MASTQPQTQTQTQTQTLGLSFDPDDIPVAWGRLCPTAETADLHGVMELVEDEISFGRDDQRCQYTFTELQISSVHCQIVRNTKYGTSSGRTDTHVATLFDCSTNGTWINRKKIGKGNSQNLFDGDEIQFVSYSKRDCKLGTERRKVSFLFYKNREVFKEDAIGATSIFARYDLRGTLGTGSFAVVKVGIDRETGARFAVKVIDKKKYEMKSKSRKHDDIMNESNILRQIAHKNIIKVYDVFDEDGMLYIVLEMAVGGELFQRIVDKDKLSETDARYVMRQLLDALMYLHGNKIAHRDLKPENILLADKNSWDIKITDFGLSRLLECDQETLTTMCGTPLFLAPEVLSSKKRGGYGFEVDYWSIGVILYLMLVGHPPYNEKEGQLLDLVKHGRFSFPDKTWSAVSKEAKDLVQHLMDMNVTTRYNGEQVLAHPWMQQQQSTKHKVSGKKRRLAPSDSPTLNGAPRDLHTMHISEQKELEGQHHNISVYGPPVKRYKNGRGEAVNPHQMSLSVADSLLGKLAPFDSLVEQDIEPKRDPKDIPSSALNEHNARASNSNLKPPLISHIATNDQSLDPQFCGNGNGASFVKKNSISVKDMSLD
mmetsp:Transcript_10911/g.16478  ORF Transcript_10911/g.16478 Transcript_10911/m.16478 type:complete len:599 (+) Transcript_10911:44-1840(+)|eukprot:CAMPEP_0202733622 /NCGR_PEP_ID=MMETSP1385-20130828/188262_1 /ASSEMBLY_ACC=CAM_ASM_000861 /TAXON_ID=933848 /ORGANISM="Elphidium margaritaceum" /LENGTH=598 /DNA_ID=CAMNT_0049399961 /DNA_START=9 /DNA_END=1805 /DNA_ORIENTATION=-